MLYEEFVEVNWKELRAQGIAPPPRKPPLPTGSIKEPALYYLSRENQD